MITDTPATLDRHERGEGRDDRRIPPSPIDERPIVRGPTQSDCSTRPLNREAALCHQMGDDLPSFSRP